MFIRPPHLVLAVAGLASRPGRAVRQRRAPAPPELLSRASGARPAATLTPEMRGDIFMARKMYREAIDIYQASSSRNPVLWNKTGIAYNQLPNQLDQARKAYQQAIKLKPDYAEAINNLGTVYYATKSYRRAISYYQKAIALAPDDPRSASFYLNLGIAFFARKQYEQCAEANQMALKLDPGSLRAARQLWHDPRRTATSASAPSITTIMAKMYAKAGRNDLALQYLRKALEEGFKEKDKLKKDPEFAGMRDTPEFKELLASEPRVL